VKQFSQNDEEIHIVSYFAVNRAAPRRFLDIGAHDGVQLSNTRKLAENGWTGTLVEPSPAPFVGLMDNYREIPDANLVHVAVVPERSKILGMRDSRGDFVSTFDRAHEKLWAAPGADGRPGVKFQEIFVYGVTVADLLDTFPGPYSFISLDVEGINFQIFRELPLNRLGTELICVEYQDELAAIETCAAVQGFLRYHITTENILLARRT
jgi:FkbM family methyltransferase